MKGGKTRVLHVIKTLSLGGAETNLLNLVRALDPARYENHVAYSFGGEIEGRFLKGGVRLFKYAEGSHKIKSFQTIPIVLRLARYILKHDIDVVHTHIFNAHIWGALAAKLSGRKVVEHVHDFRYLDPEDFTRRRGSNTQYRHAGRFASLSDRVIILTRQNRDFLVEKKLQPDFKVRQIQNGIPLNGNVAQASGRRAEVREKFGIADSAQVILTSARISDEKNVDLVFRIVPEVLRHAPGAVFLISGDGPLLAPYKEKVRQMGLEDRIRMIGYYDNAFELLAASDLFLLPSFLELHSIAVLEAMSMGLPLVLSKGVGSNDEFIIDGENGVLLDPFSDDGWAGAVVRILRETGLRESLGRKAKETVLEKFDIRRIARQFEGVYDELVR